MNIKLNPTIFSGKKLKPNKTQNTLAWNLTCIVSLISSLPGKSSSKSASCVITQTLPVSVSFNLIDPLEVQKPRINLFNTVSYILPRDSCNTYKGYH